MEKMVYESGVAFARRNVGLTIFGKLARDGITERV
jgi:hypothetical protein